MSTQRRWMAALLTALCATGVACAADGSEGTGTDATADELAVSGTYNLALANGGSLPVSFPKDSKSCVRTILSASLTLATTPNHYLLRVPVRSTCDSGIGAAPTVLDATLLENGTWTAANGTFTPTHLDGSTIVATGPVEASTSSLSFSTTITFADVSVQPVTLSFHR